jgi:hypothetical protein
MLESHTLCDEHPKKMTVAQPVNSRTDVPSEMQILLRQHSTLEISPLITIITASWLQLGLVTNNRRLVCREARVNCC